MDITKKYKAAEKLAPWNIKNLALNISPKIHFDGDKLTYTKDYFSKGVVKTKLIELDLNTLEEKEKKAKKPQAPEEYHPEYTSKVYSPDKKSAIYTKDHNFYLEKGKKTFQITKDGNENYSYGDIIWSRVFYTEYLKHNKGTSALYSPDGTKILVAVTIKENIGKLTLVQNFNKDSFKPMHPITMTYDDWFPFENYKIEARYAIIDVKSHKIEFLKDKAYKGYGMVEFSCKWDEDSKGFYHMEGFAREKELYHASLDTMSSTLLAKETIDTYFFDESIHHSDYDFIGPVKVLKNGRIIWYSQKDDMGSFYFIDPKTKEIGTKINDGTYNVSNLMGVDEDNETIYFMGSCFKDFSEPYYGSLCSIKFDGTEFKRYDDTDLMHQVYLDPKFRYYVDVQSRSDLAPKTVLKSLDGKINKVLLDSDIKKLLKAGYSIPQRFKVYSDETGYDIYGIIVLPKDYSPLKKYPVIDYVYGGMQIANCPKSFSVVGDIPGRECFGGLEGFQALGFIGVVIDGPGTPWRGKKFHDISYRNMGNCSGLFSHKEVITKLSKDYPGMDLNRVGIWGNSAGGYATVRALCFFNDFYKVGVSSAGDHDNQIYSASWALRFNGPYDEKDYKFQDNARYVDKLEGKLLLVHGLLDDNVHPSQTFRLIEFLEKANKEYDLAVLPDTDHNCPANPYFQRRRFDYFVKNLMGVEPPHNYLFKNPFFNYDKIEK